MTWNCRLTETELKKIHVIYIFAKRLCSSSKKLGFKFWTQDSTPGYSTFSRKVTKIKCMINFNRWRKTKAFSLSLWHTPWQRHPGSVNGARQNSRSATKPWGKLTISMSTWNRLVWLGSVPNMIPNWPKTRFRSVTSGLIERFV